MEQRERIGAIGAVAAGVVGLAVSTVLLVDSVGPKPAFCAEGGCAAVRATAWAKPLGVPMPVLGLAFFAIMIALGLAGPRVARLRSALAIAGALGALGLLTVQGAVIGAWCKFCVVADLSALAMAAAIVVGKSARWAPRRASTWAFAAALAAVAIGVPLRGLRDEAAPVKPAVASAATLPAPIAHEQQAGVVTIVDFIDFECPFCRAMHARLVDAVAQAGVPTRVVRKMVPLTMHKGALAAAIAWCCAERQGQGDAMAEALIAAKPEQLTPEGCAQLAATLGLDMARYRQDAADPAIAQRIAADRADAEAADVRRLPTIYIGRERFDGAGANAAALIASLRRAAV